jgi:hypothetical protein
MWIDIQQNTYEWLDRRIAKVTGSSVSCVMAHQGKLDKEGLPKFGDPAKSLATNIAIERMTGKKVITSGYKSSDMKRGHEEEPIAIILYEDMFFISVQNGGFYDNGKTGCSPDGLVGSNGLVEVKSVLVKAHLATIERGTFDPTYKWQCFFNLNESGREWIDFVSYCSSYPKKTNLFVDRIEKGDIVEEIEMMEKRLEEFESLVEEVSSKIINQ